MELIEDWTPRKSFFIFDLEFIGDVRNLKTCQIWEIAVYSLETQQWFEEVVDPDPGVVVFPPPPIPEIPQLTREFLNEKQAQTWSIVFQKLEAWVSAQSVGVPIFVSHNTFRADKPIMELECRRFNQQMPLNWYFFDSLHFSRQYMKNTSGNYSLSGLHQQLFDCPIENAHRARADVVACIKIMTSITKGSWNLQGPVYPVYSTSLRTIRWIGQKAEKVLYNQGIRSTEELFALIQKNARIDKVQFNNSSEVSIFNTLITLIQNRLPLENVKNIANVISETSIISCYTFMTQ
tara:strand:+ start:1238 stop:2113 length:876 start_codon:yes stop_codon:yes gene_type:complete